MMKIELRKEDLETIARKVAAQLTPLLSKGQHPPADEILDLAGLCAYLKVTPNWIYQRTHKKSIPHIKPGGGQLLFRRREIDKWLEQYGIPSSSRRVG